MEQVDKWSVLTGTFSGGFWATKLEDFEKAVETKKKIRGNHMAERVLIIVTWKTLIGNAWGDNAIMEPSVSGDTLMADGDFIDGFKFYGPFIGSTHTKGMFPIRIH